MNADAASARDQPALRLEQRLSGRPLALARLGWWTLAASALAIYSVSVVARYLQVRDSQTTVELLRPELGLTAGFYAGYLTALTSAFGLGCFVIAALILRGRSDDRMALFVSLFLITIGAVNAPNMQAMSEIYPRLDPLINVAMVGAWSAFLFFLLLFPDGRFVPHWTRPLSIAWAAALIFATVATRDSLMHPEAVSTSLLILGGLATGAGAQIYRYLRAASTLHRQQTKWIVFGIVSAILIQIVTALLEPAVPVTGRAQAGYELFQVTVVTLAFLLVPVSIGIAILRHRLWDIDIIINRTLVYALLTASVVGVYVLTVGGLGTIVQTRGTFGTSLLAAGLVAVLFQPLRERLQRGINHLMYGERGEPYAVLSRLGQRLEGSLAPGAILPAIVQTACEALKLPYAAIALQHDESASVAAEAGQTVEPTVSLPLIYQGETVGQLILGVRSGEDGFGESDMRLLSDLARQAGVAAHGVRLMADLQRSRERLVTAREEERRRLRRDLHDGLGPQLASQTLTIDAAIRLLNDDPATAAELLADLKAQAQDAVTDIRRLVYELRPPALDDLGLIGAIRSQADAYRHTGLDIAVHASAPLPPLPAAVEVACFRIAQEALTNCVRHAHATRCDVTLTVAGALLQVEIRDNGRGLPDRLAAGVGLQSMRERAAELGGTCDVFTWPNGGTCVSARLPLPLEER